MIEFNCQFYIGVDARMHPALRSSKQQKIARIEPISHFELIEPRMRRLLATFESLPQPLLVV